MRAPGALITSIRLYMPYCFSTIPKFNSALLANVGKIARVQCRQICDFQIRIVDKETYKAIDETQRAVSAKRGFDGEIQGAVTIGCVIDERHVWQF